jgi:hypothetical protein
VRRILGSLIAVALMTFGLTGVTAVVTAQPAHALCQASNLEGDWKTTNIFDFDTVQVNVRFVCNDQRICDPICHGPDVYHTIRPFIRCHPVDCDLGTARADNVNGWIRAGFVHGADHHWIWVSSLENGAKVRVFTDIDRAPYGNGDGPEDTIIDEVMVR